MRATGGVRVPVAAWLVSTDTEGPLRCVLRYDPADPWAVVLELRTIWQTVTWRFARELLAAGRATVAAPTGGDVAVSPSPSGCGVRVELVPGTPRAVVVVLALESVEEFLAQSYREVPAGAEHERERRERQAHLSDWDSALAVLVRGEVSGRVCVCCEQREATHGDVCCQCYEPGR